MNYLFEHHLLAEMSVSSSGENREEIKEENLVSGHVHVFSKLISTPCYNSLPWGNKLQCRTRLLYTPIDQSRFEVVLKLAQHFQFSLGKEICLHDVMTLFES